MFPKCKYIPNPTHQLSLKSEGKMNKTDVEAPIPGCKPKLDIICRLGPQI